MESRFGYNFGRVRVHDGTSAAASVRAVNAVAYTVGSDLVFADGQYRPQTLAGERLIAHELAHVVQQRGSRSSASPLLVAAPGGEPERAADLAAGKALHGTARGEAGITTAAEQPMQLQRRMVATPAVVPNPAGGAGTPFTAAVQGLMAEMCPTGGFRVDPGTGVVSSRAAFCEWHPPLVVGATEASISSTPAGCGCLCQVVNDAQTTTIAFRPGGPSTSPGSVPGAGPGQGGVATSPTVDVDPRFRGQYFVGGRWVDVPFHLILSHELCGHALPKMRGTHVSRGPSPPGGTPPQEQAAVDVERQIAAEHSPPLPRRPEDYSGGARERP